MLIEHALNLTFFCNKKGQLTIATMANIFSITTILSSKGSQTLHSHATVTALQRGVLSYDNTIIDLSHFTTRVLI